MSPRCINNQSRTLSIEKSCFMTWMQLQNTLMVPPIIDALVGTNGEHDASTSQSRRSQRVSHPPEHFCLVQIFLLLTDCGEPSCYR